MNKMMNFQIPSISLPKSKIIIYKEDISGIITGLYISNFETSLNLEMLKKHNIKTILCFSMIKKTDLENQMYADNDIVGYQNYINDLNTVNISDYFDESFNRIEEGLKRDNVLVHCDAGISRSATIVASYIGKKQKIYNTENVLELMRKNRNVYPNIGFQRQLDEYFDRLKK
jgi:dual specificity MAP kinase phosphatase